MNLTNYLLKSLVEDLKKLKNINVKSLFRQLELDNKIINGRFGGIWGDLF